MASMIDITSVLESESGLYEWRVRDCCTTAAKVVGRPITCYATWHKLTEAKAIVKAKKRYGSVAAAHEAVLTKALRGADCGEYQWIPGDVVWLKDNRSGASDNIGYVGRDYQVYTWLPHGIGVAPTWLVPSRVIRCLL